MGNRSVNFVHSHRAVLIDQQEGCRHEIFRADRKVNHNGLIICNFSFGAVTVSKSIRRLVYSIGEVLLRVDITAAVLIFGPTYSLVRTLSNNNNNNNTRFASAEV